MMSLGASLTVERIDKQSGDLPVNWIGKSRACGFCCFFHWASVQHIQSEEGSDLPSPLLPLLNEDNTESSHLSDLEHITIQDRWSVKNCGMPAENIIMK